ncbi:MAG: hypothetical protein AB4911_24560 [Oscillochloridaceae bacterium umkhey_bin13]
MPDSSAIIGNLVNKLTEASHGHATDLVAAGLDQVLAQAGPRQAEVLRRVALPRWLDASVLRVLRESDEGNERVLALLRQYSFVRDLGDGRLALTEEVRSALCDEWQRTRPDEARTIHRRLYSYFSTRTTPPGATNRAMPLMPESTTLSVMQISTETDLLRREALYHLLQIDQPRGLIELRRAFEALEHSHRLAEAELLLQMATETPLGPRERRWVHYLRARVLQAALRLDEARAQLEALDALGDLEPALAAEADCTLGEIYSETGQWAKATELFRKSSAYFARVGDQQAVAETMLLLGEAYQGMGISTGSWHVPAPPSQPVLRLLHDLWLWLLGLPFQFAILLIGRRSRLLPLPQYCARYQNWLLIRLYNTARACYTQAATLFRQLDNPVGNLRAEQRLADLLLLYGYHDEACSAIRALLERPAARDPYRRAWLQRSLAECYLAAGELDAARPLLDTIAIFFREVGDVRREASVVTLQGRAAMQAGQLDAALHGYAAGLARFRTLGYAAARERILHELRVWQRQPERDPLDRMRLAAMVDAEPEKRYVGRFIRSYQTLLQLATLLALPLALLLLAMVAPTTILRPSELGVFNLAIFFDPWRMLGAGTMLIMIYLAIYAAIATAVIDWLPIARIEREQPDQLVTTPKTITRYDQRGVLTQQVPWAEVTQWLTLDRCLWDRPLDLYSRSYLADQAGRYVLLDGITGWYADLQADCDHRLAASGSQAMRKDLGDKMLPSWAGLSVASGLILLLIVTFVNNNWALVGALFPAAFSASLWFLALSGMLVLVPLAFWLATQPFTVRQRLPSPSQRWPVVVTTVGALASFVALLGLIPVAALNYSMLVWGAYLLAEGIVALVAPGKWPLRLAATTLTVLLALALVATPAQAQLRWLEGYIARVQVEQGTMAASPSCEAAAAARNLGGDPFSTWAIQGDCASASGDWSRAADYYAAAAQAARPGSGEQALAFYNLAVAAEAAGDTQLAQQARISYEQICGLRGAPALCRQLGVGR